MSLVERIAKEVEAAELLEARARAVVDQLSPESLARVCVYIMRKVEQNAARTPQPVLPVNDAAVLEAFKPEAAEAFVLAQQGRGVTPATVAKHIGCETARGADEALRRVQRDRGTVVRAKGQWYPAGTVPEHAKKIGLLVLDALADGDVLSTADIYERILKVAPDTKKASVAVEINRLMESKAIQSRGRAPHSRGYLYALKSEGGAAGTG